MFVVKHQNISKNIKYYFKIVKYLHNIEIAKMYKNMT